MADNQHISDEDVKSLLDGPLGTKEGATQALKDSGIFDEHGELAAQFGGTGKETSMTLAGSFATPQDPAPVVVPDGWKLLKDTAYAERSWPEDASHENGNYHNDCIECGRTFLGHKRRCVCRSCASAPAIPPGGAQPADLAEQALRSIMDFRHTPHGMVRGGRYIDLDDAVRAIRAAIPAGYQARGHRAWNKDLKS